MWAASTNVFYQNQALYYCLDRTQTDLLSHINKKQILKLYLNHDIFSVIRNPLTLCNEVTFIDAIGAPGLEKLGFLVNETPCSSKQVQVHVVPSQFGAPSDATSYKCLPHRIPRRGPNEIDYRKKTLNKFSCGCIQCFFLSLTG